MPIFGTVKEFGGESLLLTTEAQALQLDEQLMRSQIENKKLQDLLLHTHTPANAAALCRGCNNLGNQVA